MMKTTSATFALVAAMLAMTPMTATAESAALDLKTHREPMTKDAFLARAAARFAKMDVNGDGVLEQSERRAAMAKTKGGSKARRAHEPGQGKDFLRKMILRADADGDGVISGEEIAAARSKMEERRHKRDPFARMDSNGDGAISSDEVDAFVSKIADRGPHRGQMGEAPMAPPPAAPDRG